MLMSHQETADCADVLRKILPAGKCFVVVLAGEKALEPVQVFGNLDLQGQVNLLQDGREAALNPTEQGMVRPRQTS